MKALRSPRCQERGVVFVGDLGGAAFGNLDLRVPKAILGAIGKAVPLRLHRACIVRPFMLMRLVIPIIKMFMSEKMRQRLQVLGGPEQLAKHGLEMKKLPEDVGGTGGEQAHNYMAMLAQWVEEERSRESSKKGKEGKTSRRDAGDNEGERDAIKQTTERPAETKAGTT
uniref:CRAL-TRIO domain-containing protein n=1 Tax=Lotharella oceanica TaxID=641309 RepID=A0A7S2XCS9_9EUKA|mmetsp:Transcript_30903/g.57707  ORF Transcript_30903/g.57707 Transcript_30903/m.57707 type:complete len:169 (+) Transcript_30903:2-508(+)